MTKVDNALESVLEGYASFLRKRMLAALPSSDSRSLSTGTTDVPSEPHYAENRPHDSENHPARGIVAQDYAAVSNDRDHEADDHCP